jgi:hypothetical protein
MGAACGKGSSEGNDAAISGRGDAITGGAQAKTKGLPKLPLNATKSAPDDYSFIEVRASLHSPLAGWVEPLRAGSSPKRKPPLAQEALSRLLLFSKLNPDLQRKIVMEMHERTVHAGEILINEGDTGLAATELYVVKSGKFEVRLPIQPAQRLPLLSTRM